MRVSKVIVQRDSASRRLIARAKYFSIVLTACVGSSLVASSSSAQDHDHSAMPTVEADSGVDHAGHVMTTDERADTLISDDHAQHEAVQYPHANHVMTNDDHAGHGVQASPHAQHTDTTARADHSQHTEAPASHTGHVMSNDDHAGHVAPAAHNHDDMGAEMNMSSSSAQSGRRDPHAYSNGLKVGEGPYALENSSLHLMDEVRFGGFRMNRMEQLFIDGNDAIEYDALAWYGTSYDRVVLKAEGELQRDTLEESNTELLWTHAVHSFWNTQIGVSNQTGDGPDRNWLAIGLQGTAPYWFEVDATVYFGESGRSAFNLEAEYDLWLSQRLILQPRVEMNFYGKNDQATATGSGLSDLATGIRLQYQINRQLIPYAGVEQVRMYGQTAKYSGLSSGESETRWLAGLRFWF